jgi:hypothetical protein
MTQQSCLEGGPFLGFVDQSLVKSTNLRDIIEVDATHFGRKTVSVPNFSAENGIKAVKFKEIHLEVYDL